MIDLPPCPAEGEAPRHSWVMSAANRYAHRAFKEAVDLITSGLTRAPSPYNEVETTVRKAFAEAAQYAGHNGGDIPQRPARHTSDISGDASKGRATKRAAWPEFTAPSDAQREAIAGLLVVAPEAIEAICSRGMLFYAESSEGPALVICERNRKSAASLRLDGAPWESSGQLEKFLPGSERGWPIGLDKDASPIFLAAGAAGFIRISHLPWCAEMEREVAATALLDTSLPIAPAARPLFAGRRVCAFFNPDSRVAGALLAAGAHISTFDFSPYKRDDEQPVRDLAGFIRPHPDDWEAVYAAFTEAAAPPQPSVP